MKKVSSILLLSLVLLAFTSTVVFLVLPPSIPQEVTIYGKVTDREVMLGITGVNISLHQSGECLGHSVTTGASGYYSITFKPITSHYELRTTHESFFPQIIGPFSVEDTNTNLEINYKHNFWALIVAGCENDESESLNFDYTALRWHDVLKNHYGFTEDEIYFLSHKTYENRDRITTRENIEWAIDEIAKRSTNNDQVLVFWTGHGSYDKLSLLPDPTRLHISELDSALDTITCKEMMIFLSTCYSGSFIDDLSGENEPNNNNRIIFTSTEHNKTCDSNWATLICSTLDPTQVTPYVLKEADSNPKDNRVSLEELRAFIYDWLVIDPDKCVWIGSLIDPERVFVGYSNFHAIYLPHD